MQEEICVVIIKRWFRIHNIEFIEKLLETILIYFNIKDEEVVNELFVNIAVIGDDCSDKIGLIYNYIYDYNCDILLENDKKLKLCKQNESKILEFKKIVKLSSRNSVNISILCLSELQKHNLSQVCKLSTKSVVFTYDLCKQSSLQSIRKWYKECDKIFNSINNSGGFISILVGTNYENFKDKAANYRISIIQQSRKYANKMNSILLFISTSPEQQINIKEIFLIILSKIYHFDSNITSISNSKLPIIEFYDVNKQKKIKIKIKNKNKNKKKNKKKNYYNTLPLQTQQPHNRAKTSIEHIQNRLSIIRSNLTKKNSTNNDENNNTNNSQKVEQLYDKFENNYKTFMSNIQQQKEEEMYPAFLNNQNENGNDNDNDNEVAIKSLSDLLKDDALGLNTLDQEKKDNVLVDNDNIIRQKKHERAMSMIPSLLHRSQTYKHNNNNIDNAYGHNRAMPSMPSFLSKLHNDNQLKNIISNVFIQTQTQTQLNCNNNNNKHSNENIDKLRDKIQNLECGVRKYQNIMIENSKTVSILKKTIHKIEIEKEEATKKIIELKDDTEIEKLKNKNGELKSLADALAINLARKEQSLEEALQAIHSLNETKKEITINYNNNNKKKNKNKKKKKKEKEKEKEIIKKEALTDADILSLSHSNVQIEYESDDDNNNNVSFRKGIAKRLRSLSNSLTQINNLDAKLLK